MKRLALATAFLTFAVAPVAAQAAPVVVTTEQSYCEVIVIETPDFIYVEGFCIEFSDGSL